MKKTLPLFFIALCLFYAKLNAQQVIAHLTGSPVDTTGWTFVNSAKITNLVDTGKKEILLTPLTSAATGAVYYRTPITLGSCTKLTVEFDFRIHDGNGDEGMTFCFLDSAFSYLVAGVGLGIPAKATGLRVCFDTHRNCGPPAPKILIRWRPNGVPPKGGECDDTQPTADNSTKGLSLIRSPYYVHAKITYEDGSIKVYLNDSLYLKGFHHLNTIGYAGFTASTGGGVDNHSVKNVVISTEQSPVVYKVNGKRAGLCGGGIFIYQAQSTQYSNYIWSVPAGTSILSGQGTNSIQLQVSPSFTAGIFSVTPASACGTGNTYSDTIFARPVKPTPITGPTTVTTNQTNINFSTTDSNDVSFYWTVPDDATILAGQGTNAITVNWGKNSGEVIVRALQCNDSAKQRLSVKVVNTVAFRSNTSWKATTMYYDGWEKSDFNDTLWDNALSPSPGDCDQYYNSMWGPRGIPTVYLRKKFYIPGNITKIDYKGFGVDDDADVYINDTLIIHNDDCVANDIKLKSELHAHLQKGWNTMAIKAHDCGGCYTVQVDFDVLYSVDTIAASSIVFNSEMVEDRKLIVYPNPAISTLNIQFNENKAGKYSIVISDVAGKIVYTNKAISTTGYNNVKVNISGLAKGMYTIILFNGDLKQVKQFMKQ